VGYEAVELPERTVAGHNGNGSYENHFWAYKFDDYSMWNQCGEMAWDNVMLMGECLRTHKRVTNFSNSEKRLWLEIDGKFAHSNENGAVIPDILVMTGTQLEEIHRLLKAHKNYSLITQNINKAYGRIKEILKQYNHKVLHSCLDYYIFMEMCSTMRMMAVHDLVDSGFLQLPEDPKKSTLGMHFILN
jgi:hypothetical protein